MGGKKGSEALRLKRAWHLSLITDRASDRSTRPSLSSTFPLVPPPNLFHPTICSSIIQFFNTRDDSSLRRVEINRLASISIYIYIELAGCSNDIADYYTSSDEKICLRIDRRNDSYLELLLVSTIDILVDKKERKKRKKRKEKERIFLEYLYKSDTYFALYRI